MSLQSYVLPVCVYREEANGSAAILRLHGTSFLINPQGAFLTAAHVLKNANLDAEASGLKVGLVCKDENGSSSNSVVSRLKSFSFAQGNADIAIGQSFYVGPTIFQLSAKDFEVWQDVGTYGYPQEAVSGPISGLRLNLRAHKGYIQRLVRAGDIFAAPEAIGFELSFLLARGLSGSPLFVHDMPYAQVIGVCVGSFRSETVEDEVVEVLDGGKEYREKRMSISQYGLSESIVPLMDWRPECFGGRTLAEIATF